MDFLFSVFRKHICPPVFAAFCILRLWGIFQLPWVLVSGHQAALCLSAAQRSHCPTTKHLSLLLFESCSALPHGKQNLKHPCHCIRSLMARATWALDVGEDMEVLFPAEPVWCHWGWLPSSAASLPHFELQLPKARAVPSSVQPWPVSQLGTACFPWLIIITVLGNDAESQQHPPREPPE